MKNLKIIRSFLKEGKYFEESTKERGDLPLLCEGSIINVFDEIKYQSVLGFGGAFTEAAAYNYSLMSKENKELFMKAYFDPKNGIGYNFGRTHINACDFALDHYVYVKDGDATLESFDITRDKKYIIPFIKDAQKYIKDELVLFASPWTPPAYMKDNKNPFKGGKLLDEYKKTWALYYAKYIKAYAKEGIKISAITIQNEPIAIQTWESCQYSPEDERDFIADYIIPVFDEEGLNDIKIIVWDHNKERVYDRARDIFTNEKVKEKVWGIGFHWYTGDHFDGMRIAYEAFKKPLLCTEFCADISDNPVTVAERYVKEICGNFNNYTIASCDWNLLLSKNGGPYHNRTPESSEKSDTGAIYDSKNGGCFAPILYDEENKKVILTPIYYAIGHISKYVKRGAKRIAYTKYIEDLTVCAFENPNGEKVCVLLNATDSNQSAILRESDGTCTRIDAPAHSVATIIYA